MRVDDRVWTSDIHLPLSFWSDVSWTKDISFPSLFQLTTRSSPASVFQPEGACVACLSSRVSKNASPPCYPLAFRLPTTRARRFIDGHPGTGRGSQAVPGRRRSRRRWSRLQQGPRVAIHSSASRACARSAFFQFLQVKGGRRVHVPLETIGLILHGDLFLLHPEWTAVICHLFLPFAIVSTHWPSA